MIEHQRILGRGAAGTVYLAEIGGLRVAVKRPDASIADTVTARHRAMASLEDDNLVRVIDVGGDDRGAYVLLGHVDGCSLDELLAWIREADELIVVQVAIGIVGQVARGLSALHAAGWVHGDVSPSNVLVGKDGRVRLGDFDTTVPLADASALATRVGKSRYMAPEVVDGAAISQASDVFALGAVLFETLFGVPFSTPSASAATDVSSRLLDALDARDDLPDAALEVLFATLAEDADLRPDVSEVARRLEEHDDSIRRYVRSFDDRVVPMKVPMAQSSEPNQPWQIKGAALAATVEYLVDRFGEQEYGRMVERLPEDCVEQARSPFDPSAWYDGRLLVELTLTAEAVFRSPPMKLAREIGAWSADRALSPGGPYQTFRDKGLRRGTRAFMDASEDIYGLYYDIGEWRLLEIDDHQAICEITTRLPAVVEERIFAYLDRAMHLIGARDHRVERKHDADRIWMRVTWGS
jgi:Protein kinase domain